MIDEWNLSAFFFSFFSISFSDAMDERMSAQAAFDLQLESQIRSRNVIDISTVVCSIVIQLLSYTRKN